jgi:hypothetical protein
MDTGQLETYEIAVELLEQFDTCFLDLGKLLRQAQDDDPELFAQLLKLPGLGRRKAFYLAKLDRVFGDYPVDTSQLTEIGWTKLSMIAPHVCGVTLFYFLDLARNYTVHQLKAILKNEPPVEGARVVVLYFEPRQYEVYAKALIKHGAKKKGEGIVDHEKAILNLIASVKNQK